MANLRNNRNSKKRSNKFSPSKYLPKIPHFGTLLFGMLIGIFVSSLAVFMFATSDITLRFPSFSKPQPKQSAVAAAEIPAVQEPRFDFYTELTKNSPDPAPDLKSKPKAINGYVVQAGPFKNVADADALKAKLTLNGYAARIEAVKQSSGEIWHRVFLGSFKSEQSAKALQQKLKALDINGVKIGTI